MRIFKTRIFSKWAKKHHVHNAALVKAVIEMNNGMSDASYGGYLFKKRVAAKGRGKSGSIRTILAFKAQDKSFFVYGFEKNERSNITEKEAKAYKLLAKALINLTDKDITIRINNGSLIEVNYE